MSLFVIESGILTTIQDLGRNGFRRFGINPSGAMDKMAAYIANLLLGNQETQAVLETHFPAPKLQFEKPTTFALCGADFAAKLNETEIENWRPIVAKEGDILTFNERRLGARLYLAVAGGFEVEKVFGSASTDLRTGLGKLVKKGDRLLFKEENRVIRKNYKVSESLIPRYSHFPTVRIFQGPEFDKLTAISVENLLKKSYKVSLNADRMGFLLEGEPLYLIEDFEMVSSPVDFGTIQLLPNGQIIVLMADHQTTGGYPRIAQIAKVDLPIVAQLSPNDKLYFEMISYERAEELALAQQINLNMLKWAVRLG
ncbi:MAG: biotin-dependent carboxyltransferase family protein [Pyrinomonadaceae bacterium]|nr:biotin-dependent carboxyltransferase family protein [Pyrinomonadaceae bacterium]MCX7638862.1 biotin-dependent carboxyltransferase family protein [Pyrinomonadaceae bacterium]MDW8305002.1 biotin-dependent carboxyltransferase family protein [Acidobacteriota bacterium]